MKIYRFIRANILLAWYGWAEREINKLHPDLPGIVMKQHALREELARIFA